MGKTIDRQKIAQRAYQIFEERGRAAKFDNWTMAERELLNRERAKKESARKKSASFDRAF
jgi:hypothetical protein